MISNAFRNICALSLGANVIIDATKNRKDAPKEAPKKEEKPKKEEPKKEEKPSEEDLGGLF